MAAVHVLDNYYLAITFLITVAYQLFHFAIAFSLKFDKLTDWAGGTNFVLLAILTLSFSENRGDARNIVVSVFMMAWAARLSGFLLFRILKTGKDDRFDDKRDKFWSFLGFWVFQMFWVWTCSLPVTILNSPKVTQFPQPGFGTGCDIAGIVMFAVGFTMESISDVQKYRFRSAHGSDGEVCDVGFFAWTRHPNYFGEILIQFAIFTIAVAPAANNYVRGGPYAALYASILGPIFLTSLLMFLSGLPLQERPGAKKRYEKGIKWPEYERYLRRTSILLPFPPQLYEKMPVVLKRTVFLEFPIYVFDPAKHADQSKVQANSAEEGRVRPSDEQGLRC
ncbi:3-oxo-5-alpha-steroid 4-dehydrogenase protein [Paraphaeosphaeria minitans]|uniref:3-oxo-5-alpha-steroid 4-dehydrogenase protein n=1 Tax=Paraphaeosphaeria minitans TaxID=565426 RepID=A0A9P6GK12_9PLEO|nr:3-oxo-5-alpha-steroid 4-dehydrogenase protein [Paraphaeosphaeria minitans]